MFKPKDKDENEVVYSERHVIRRSNRFYKYLKHCCHMAKNLYNHANFEMRKHYRTSHGKIYKYTDLDKLLKNDKQYPDYRNMPTAVSAQQLLIKLNSSWRAFKAAHDDWKRLKAQNKERTKYLSEPKQPKFKPRNGHTVCTFNYRNCPVKDGVLRFPKVFDGFTIKLLNRDLKKVKTVELIPRDDHVVVVITYARKVESLKSDNGRHLGVDLGVGNLATVVGNFEVQPMIINGRGLKSMNTFFNKHLAKLKSGVETVNHQHSSRRIRRLCNKRNEKFTDFVHKASKLLVQHAVDHNVSVIVVGYNEGWKQRSRLSKKVNQTFVQIPFLQLLKKIEYKARRVGIKVVQTEESFTSGTSFLDGEQPIKKHYNKSRRVRRGLFKSGSGKLINADVNAAYQILKKVFPDEFSNNFDGIKGVALRPVRVNADV